MSHAGKLGIKSTMKKEFGLMLGASEATLLDMARVYGTFANQGVANELAAIRLITDQKGKVLYSFNPEDLENERVISEQIAFLMIQGMRQVLARGTGHAASHLAHVAAGKTGTSNNNTDNWFTSIQELSDMLGIFGRWIPETGTNNHQVCMIEIMPSFYPLVIVGVNVSTSLIPRK